MIIIIIITSTTTIMFHPIVLIRNICQILQQLLNALPVPKRLCHISQPRGKHQQQIIQRGMAITCLNVCALNVFHVLI